MAKPSGWRRSATRRSCERCVSAPQLPPRYSVLSVLRRSPRPRRHENTILLDKLSKILTREKGAQGGGAKLPKVAAPPTAGGGLHDAYRKKVREQIDRENQSLLRRLQYMKPSIDMVHFEQQWRENAQFARSQVIGNPMLEPRVAPRLQAIKRTGQGSEVLQITRSDQCDGRDEVL